MDDFSSPLQSVRAPRSAAPRGLSVGGPDGGSSASVALDLSVPVEFDGRRLDWTLSALVARHGGAPALSRSELKRWIDAGWITLNGARAKPRTPVRDGAAIRVRARREPRFDWHAAQALRLDVAYEDGNVIVIDKPAGLVVHPGAGNPRGTLVNGLLHRWPALAQLPRAGLVHRLDKDTSGLMVVAADASSQLALIAALGERRVERRYLALVEGRVVADQRVDLALGRDRRNRLRQAVRADGRNAVTHICVRQRFAAHTLIEAWLLTGRTHQIRVHCAAIGHPLVGDKRYGARGVVPPRAAETAAAAVRRFRRQALHARHLAFAHPHSGEKLRFGSEPPRDFQELLNAVAA